MSYLLAQASAHRIPLRDESVQTCVTSPPYWGLRAYAGEQSFVWGGEDHEHEWGAETRKRSSADTGSGIAGTPRPGNEYDASLGRHCPCGAWYGALGLEPTPALFVAHMVEVFREVRRVLRKDGTLWLNLGDSYAQTAGAMRGESETKERAVARQAARGTSTGQHGGWEGRASRAANTAVGGLKPKDLVGIPWRVAFALQADGWYLRSDIVWAKPNPMPESVTDRPTKSHEYVFLLSKSERYFYDADAIREASVSAGETRGGGLKASSDGYAEGFPSGSSHNLDRYGETPPHRNARSVWNIATQPYSGAHFATFPEELPERCIKAGSAPSDVVLDPFNGSGTTGRVAMRLGRRYVGLDMSREYLVEQAVARIDPIAASRRDFANGVEQSQGVLL